MGKFYDTWVTRDLKGNFFHFYYPHIRESVGRAAFRRGEPFRIFSCWNGIVIFKAEPFLKGL